MLAKLRRSSASEESNDDPSPKKKMVKKLVEPIQLGKLRRPADKINKVEDKPPLLKISVLNQEAKNKFFGLDTKEKSIEELTAAVRRYIPPVSYLLLLHMCCDLTTLSIIVLGMSLKATDVRND